MILANMWFGAPFFMIRYLASLKSVPERALRRRRSMAPPGGSAPRYVTLPMMRNIIAITVLSSLIGTFAAFDVVAVLTRVAARSARPRCSPPTRLPGRACLSGDHAAGRQRRRCSCCRSGVAAILVLRGVMRRGNEA